ncbi:alpha/beta hydrolase [Nonomuraea sp. NN258]|uniref:alpha/beta fold hydrolase n=1 Tax=Nonomuraea antri TaxID=2730852 RepID=UPI0015697EE6|nr:alpha/beta hydrolase [Nonomuraea antri]NRQ33599.1 alpha/beta hydrolase [Nonomuraea antri]
MPHFSAHDGTKLAYHLQGTGSPLVCLPGGPARPSRYLGDLGGIPRRLILADGRGTGESDAAADPETYRWDRLADDVEALREHLGLDRVDLLAHSAGANVAIRYAGLHPERVSSLALITPSTVAAGFVPTPEDQEAGLARRAHEPWYEQARASYLAEEGTEFLPLFYGRWDDEIAAHALLDFETSEQPPALGFYAPSPVTPEEVRAGIARLDAPVLVLAGEVDAHPCRDHARSLAGLFPDARLVMQRGVAHFPWVDEPADFARIVTEFLDAR